MCDGKTGCECEKPENLKGKPEECSPEQIRKCHGDVKEHPCVKPAEKRSKKHSSSRPLQDVGCSSKKSGHEHG